MSVLCDKQSCQGQRNWSVDRREREREARAGAGLDVCECGVGRSHQSLPLHISAVHGDSCPRQKNIPGSHTLAPQNSLSQVQPSSQRVFNTVQEVPKSLSQGLTLSPIRLNLRLSSHIAIPGRALKPVLCPKISKQNIAPHLAECQPLPGPDL